MGEFFLNQLETTNSLAKLHALVGVARRIFNGVYVTKDVDQGYLDFLDTLRNDDAKAVQRQNEVENLEMHNEG